MDDKTDKSRWVRCPSCYCKTRIKVYEDSTIQQLALLSIVITLFIINYLHGYPSLQMGSHKSLVYLT